MAINWSERAVAQTAMMHPYVPGKPIEALLAEAGITEAIKLASNENPYGPPPGAVEAIRQHAAGVSRYPDGDARVLKASLAERHGVSPAHVLVGNGSSEILELVIKTFAGPGDEVVFSSRAFIMYPLYARAAGAVEVSVPEADGLAHDLDAMAAAVTERTKVVCIANPNNPTGTVHSYADIQRLLDRIPGNVVVLLDEAYYEFMDASKRHGGLSHPGLVVCRTFSKAFGLAGCRIGYGIANPAIFSLVNRFRPPFNTSVLAQAAALAALKDEVWVADRVAETLAERDGLESWLADAGLLAGRSAANFVLIRHAQSERLMQGLERQGVIPRPLQPYGMADYLRITVGTPAENARFREVLSGLLEAVLA